MNVTDELPFNLLDLNPQVAKNISFVSTAMVSPTLKNRVTIAPGFNETDYIWTGSLTISDGVNTAVRLPSFKIHVVNLHPILYTNLSDINITVPNSIAINLNYSDPEGSPSTNMTLLGSNLNFIKLVLGNLILINTTYLTPTTYYNGLQLVLTDGANTVNLPTFNVFINNTAPYFNSSFQNFTILVGSYTKYVMPSYFDPENNPNLIFKNATPFPTFVTFNKTSLEFQFMPTFEDGNTHSEIIL